MENVTTAAGTEPNRGVGLRLPPDVAERLRLEAFQRRMPQGEVVAEALREHWARAGR